jgi:AcrR family transcriptional regulator
MEQDGKAPSSRHVELVEAAYEYALTHGLSDLSLRPLATAIGSSPRVLLYLYGSKDNLIRALLERARRDEVAFLDEAQSFGRSPGLPDTTRLIWRWLAADEHRPLLCLWVEAYGRSLIEPGGPWAGFARQTVEDWLSLLAASQEAKRRKTAAGLAERSTTLAMLRGALLDLLATGDRLRTSTIVETYVRSLEHGAGRVVSKTVR